jgi:hypothetical protein
MKIDLEESKKQKEIEDAEHRLKAVKIDIERKIAIKRIQDREEKERRDKENEEYDKERSLKIKNTWMIFYRKMKDFEKESDRIQAFKMIRFFNKRLLKNVIRF